MCVCDFVEAINRVLLEITRIQYKLEKNIWIDTAIQYWNSSEVMEKSMILFVNSNASGMIIVFQNPMKQNEINEKNKNSCDEMGIQREAK